MKPIFIMGAIAALGACEQMPSDPPGLVATDVFLDRALDNYNVGQPPGTINPVQSAPVDDGTLLTS